MSPAVVATPARRRQNAVLGALSKRLDTKSSFLGRPSIYHAIVVIFLEFFAWGLLTAPMITVVEETFPRHKFLMNGLVQSVKGFLSFVSAPLIGALSDVYGRKPFLLLTVSFTCSPIPLMKISPSWYFTLISISGICAVTFSVVFAYVADCTSEDERTWAYGLVSASFAASLITSPVIGAYLGKMYSENFVVALACAVALLDIFFILAVVPESLSEKIRPVALGSSFSWEKADPFLALRRIGSDQLILMLCITTFLSYLPEAGEYTCFFVYLRLLMGFSEEAVAFFMAVVGILSVLAQTLGLTTLIYYLGPKQSIMVGLVFEMLQLACYGFASQHWLLWTAGSIAAMGSITYPAISAFVSNHAEPNQQGVAQGVLTGIRGLCNGLGPALFGFIFYVFQVDLNTQPTGNPSLLGGANLNSSGPLVDSMRHSHQSYRESTIMPGPPFAFGAVLVLLALLVSILIPDNPHTRISVQSPTTDTGDAAPLTRSCGWHIDAASDAEEGGAGSGLEHDCCPHCGAESVYRGIYACNRNGGCDMGQVVGGPASIATPMSVTMKVLGNSARYHLLPTEDSSSNSDLKCEVGSSKSS